MSVGRLPAGFTSPARGGMGCVVGRASAPAGAVVVVLGAPAPCRNHQPPAISSTRPRLAARIGKRERVGAAEFRTRPPPGRAGLRAMTASRGRAGREDSDFGAEGLQAGQPRRASGETRGPGRERARVSRSSCLRGVELRLLGNRQAGSAAGAERWGRGRERVERRNRVGARGGSECGAGRSAGQVGVRGGSGQGGSRGAGRTGDGWVLAESGGRAGCRAGMPRPLARAAGRIRGSVLRDGRPLPSRANTQSVAVANGIDPTATNPASTNAARRSTLS